MHLRWPVLSRRPRGIRANESADAPTPSGVLASIGALSSVAPTITRRAFGRTMAEGLDQLLQAFATMESADETEDPVRALKPMSAASCCAALFTFGIGGEVRSIDSGYVAVANDVKRFRAEWRIVGGHASRRRLLE